MSDGSEGGGNGRAPVRVVHATDPSSTAAALLEEHVHRGADLAADLPSAERHVRLRVEAGRRALVPSGTDDQQVLGRAAAIRAAAAVDPPISDADVVELERLAADLARASRIRTRTEARFTENLQAKLAASSGLALHPGAIKDAGDAVVAAEKALADAEQALTDHGPRPVPGVPTEVPPSSSPAWGAELRSAEGDPPARPPVDDPVLDRPHDDFDEVALDRRRALTRGGALFLVLAGLGIAGLGLGLPPAITGILVVAGLVLGIAIAVHGRRAADLLAGDKAHNAGRLADLPDVTGDLGPTTVDPSDPPTADADADAEPEPEPEPLPEPAIAVERPDDWSDDDPWLEQRVALDGARDEAEELVRTTRRRWHQLAGIDADPYQTDAVVRAHDPQLAFDARVAEASPTVRTVAAFHRKAQARWRVLWNALGHDDPPEPEDLEGTLDQLLGGYRAAQADLRRLETAEGRASAEAETRRPLVLVEPRAWVSPTRLAQLLSSVPPQGEVIVVERETPAAATDSPSERPS